MTETAATEPREASGTAPLLTVTPSSIANISAPTTVQLTWTPAPDGATVMISGIGVVTGKTQPVTTTVTTTTTFIMTVIDSSLLTSLSSAATVTVTPGFVERLAPARVISMWSGTVSSIPAGWVLCDGSNGTPNLTGKFVMGASQSIPVDSSGAGDTHTHAVPEFRRDVTTTSNGDHSHRLPSTWYQRGLSCGVWTGIDVRGDINVARLQNAGNHTHSLTVRFPAAASGQNASIVYPPSYALCFIMKL